MKNLNMYVHLYYLDYMHNIDLQYAYNRTTTTKIYMHVINRNTNMYL